MRRADRLFRIVQMLRGGRMLTGLHLAGRLEISLRTLYRDIEDLQVSGVPIEGERGFGYTLRREMDLPPMQFTAEEVTALVLGARMAQAWGGHGMAAAAKAALARLDGVLTTPLRVHKDAVQLYAPPASITPAVRSLVDRLHAACIAQQIITFHYEKLDGAHSDRRLHPLALAFWGNVWTLSGWDPAAGGFRTFRVDRVSALDVSAAVYKARRGQTLRDFMRQYLPEREWRRISSG